MNVLDGVIQCRIAICRRSNADHGGLNAGCTKCRQLFRQRRCLCACARDKDALAKKRANIRTVEPAQLLTQPYHLTDDEDRGRTNAVALYHLRRLAHGHDIGFLVGTRPPADDCRRGISRAAVFDQILCDDRKICNPHQEYQRIDTRRKMLPSYMGFRFCRIFVSRDDGKGDCHTAMCHGDARIGRYTDRRGHARQHLKRNVAFKKYKCFLPTASENEWVAALEPNDNLALVRLVRQQDIDILLPHCMLVGLFSDIDALCIGGYIGENTLVREMVIDDDIRRLQAVHCTNRQKARIARTRADKKYFSAHAVIPISFKISRPPASSSSSARAIPIFSAASTAPMERDRQTRIPSTEAIIASTWSTFPSPTSA